MISRSFAKRRLLIAGGALVAVAAAASSAPASRPAGPPLAVPAISHGLKPAVAPQSYVCTTTTSKPYYCFGGENDSTANGFTYGVYGVEGYAPNATGGVGVLGYSGNSGVSGAYGVYGVTFATNGIGVYGAGDGPTPAPNATPSSTQQSTGVVGDSHSGDGVYGSTEFPNASSPYANPVAGVIGVGTVGADNNGVAGMTSGGFGVVGHAASGSLGGVGAYAPGLAMYANSLSGLALEADGVTGGVIGTADTNSGEGGYFQNTGSAGTALYGNSTGASGYGVLGVSPNIAGLFQSSGTNGQEMGVLATSSNGYGVEGKGGIGMFGIGSGSNSVGVQGMGARGMYATGVNVAIEAHTSGEPATGVYPLEAFNDNLSEPVVFRVDGSGNIYTDGSMKSLARTRHGFVSNTFIPRTSSPTVEDTGDARLVNGVGAVRLDATLVEQMDLSSTYHVFLTPDADTRGLYIASKTPQGFVVRETQGGHGSFAFEYRIVAHVDGQSGKRMALSVPVPDRAAKIPAARDFFSSPAAAHIESVITHTPKISVKLRAASSGFKFETGGARFVPRPNLLVEGRAH